jgi:hypothetical protein
MLAAVTAMTSVNATDSATPGGAEGRGFGSAAGGVKAGPLNRVKPINTSKASSSQACQRSVSRLARRPPQVV